VKTQSHNLRLLIICLLLFFTAGCGKDQTQDAGEYVYVSVPQVALRDRVAAVYNKVGFVTNGERVKVLERSSNKRFLRVHADDGKEGWIEQRYVVDQDVYNGFAKLEADNAKDASQATAVTRRLVNMHLQPARDSDTLYQLKDATKVELLQRAITPKAGLKAIKAKEEEDKSDSSDEVKKVDEDTPAEKPESASTTKKNTKKEAKPAPVLPGQQLEDWWLVRDQQKHVGWLLGRMLDVDIPLEIAEYAEGQRIVASFVLSYVTVPDADSPGNEKKIPQYAVLMTEPHDGLPFDLNQLRVFTWNTKRSRYETAFRDRFEGKLPFVTGTEDFGKEGKLLTFSVKQLDDNGQLSERKYKMNGVIVRRVLAPGETPPSHSRRRK
jgi:uncharacterized protein YgiM (DUF1202 family)